MPLDSSDLVLLGAGASVEAGVPTTHDMTKAIVDGLGEGDAWGEAVPALHFVCATLMAHDAATDGTSPFAGLDVERVFAAVELLAERRTLEATPFVATWQAGVEEWEVWREPCSAALSRLTVEASSA